MGEKLLKYYQWLEHEGGLAAKLQLAQKTKIPSVNAAMMPDDPATIAMLKAAAKEIAGKEPPAV